ncbi:hypothetical protein GCM10022217_19360 [Chryseobacterium ginsenosidimutans]|uniref:bacteriocin-like protein n=1 Tax=Chryseobacterium ginsenosidimutans TaxID=687846 RepID=UPI0031DC2176
MPTLRISMKNLKKIPRKDLKTVQGGRAPAGCIGWDPRLMCCKAWQAGYEDDSTHEFGTTCI